MDKRKIRLQIGQLLDVCRSCPYGTNYIYDKRRKECLSCGVYAMLRQNGEKLLTPGSRGRDVETLLKKGRAMTVRDVDTALELGAERRDIAKALGISHDAFWRYFEVHIAPLRASMREKREEFGK